MKRITPTQQGFTLFEVLVSVIIFGIGLLGLAGLQSTGQRMNHDAYLRSQAVLQAYDMGDRMRANPEGLAAGAYNSIPTSVGSDPGCMTQTAGCTPAQIAQYDRWEWNSNNQTVLPAGRGSVTFDAVAATYTIRVLWDEDRDGTAGNGGDPDFSLEFRP